jgi:hypothetical protein
MRMVDGVDQFLVPGHIRELGRDLQRDLVPHHHGVALGVALGDDGQQLAGPDWASLKAKRMMRSTPARVIIDTSVAASIGWPWCTRPPTPEYSPSEFSRTMTQFRSSGPQRLSGRVDARQDARRAHVGVLVEALADLQAQAPQRDVVGDVRVAGRAEQDRVLVADGVQAVGGHHHAVLAVVVAAPVEISNSKRKLLLDLASASSTCWPAGTTSLPMPSPGMVAMRIGLHGLSPWVWVGR